MADNTIDPSFGSFSIEKTIEAGYGNQELLGDIFGEETSTADPNKIEKIETPPKKEVKQEAPKKPKAATKEEDEEDEESKKPKQKTLADLLTESEDEEASEEESQEDSTKEKDKEEGSEEEGETNTYSALAKDLLRLGVFSSDDESEEVDIKTPEQFLERFNEEKRKGANEMIENFIGRFGDDYRNAFEAIFIKGVEPKEYLGTYNNIQNFAEMDLSSEANQEAVVRQALAESGLDPDKISAKLEKIKNYGDLEDEAKTYHQILVKKEAQKLQQLERDSEARLQQAAAIKQQYVKNVTEVLQNKLKTKEFDGLPINPKLAGELQDFLITDKYKTPSGETLTDFDRTILDLKRPENHEKKVKVALLLKILEKDPTLSTIQKTGVTKQTNTLFNEVARHSQKVKTKPEGSSKASSWWVE